MKKTFKMKDLDCANCAAKMENAIKKIDGVQNAQISFMTQKITLEAPEELFEKILQDAIKICKKIEPDCVIITQ
ncbi:MAG: cation transporter [Anaerovorax sp.]|nr:cation transporter [Anaerovorax sp.]